MIFVHFQTVIKLCLIFFFIAPVFSNEFLTWMQALRLILIVLGIDFLLRSIQKQQGVGDWTYWDIFSVVLPLLGLFTAIQFDPSLQNAGPTHFFFDVIQWVSLVLCIGFFAFLLFYKFEVYYKDFFQLYTIDKICIPVFTLVMVIHGLQFFWGQPLSGLNISLGVATWTKIWMVYFLFSRFLFVFKQNEIFKIIKVSLVGLLCVVCLSIWRFAMLVNLETDANRFLANGQPALASQTFVKLIKQNQQSLAFPLYDLNHVLNDVRNKSDLGTSLGLLIKGEVLSNGAVGYGDWDEVSVCFKEFLDKENIQDKQLKLNAMTSWGWALLNLKKWSDASDVCLPGSMEFPGATELHLQSVVAQAKLRQFDQARRSLYLAIKSSDVDMNLLSMFVKTDVRSVEEVLNQLPAGFRRYASFLSYYDVVKILSTSSAFAVRYSGEKIGETPLVAPTDIWLSSLGTSYRDGRVETMGQIYLNDQAVDLGGWSRGYNLVVLNQVTGEVEILRGFDTYANQTAANAMVEFLKGIDAGKVVVALTFDEASAGLTEEGRQALKMIGAAQELYSIYENRYAWAHAVIGVKGARPGQALEMIDARRVLLNVLHGNAPEEWSRFDYSKLQSELASIGKKERQPVLFLSGWQKNSRVTFWNFSAQ